MYSFIWKYVKTEYEVCSKSIADFEFPQVTFIQFTLRWYLRITFMSTISAIVNVHLTFDSRLSRTCFGSTSSFARSVERIKESAPNFGWKTKLSTRTYTEYWLWHMVKVPWTERTFIGVQNVLRVCRMTKHANNRRKHWWREENNIDQSSNHS